jgi:cytochrome c oxidase subunit 3
MSHSEHAITNEEHGHRDDVGSKMGMWLFLFTELLLFGGMFLVYAGYRFQYSDQFRVAALELNTSLGTLNTIILLTSSLTVALAITAIQKRNKFFAIINLVMTLMFAMMFMVIKYFEWGAKFDHGIYPGSEELLNKQNGEVLFFGLYYVMTGLHGLHIIIGMALLFWVLILVVRR